MATRLRKKSVPREVLLNGWHRAIESGEVSLPEIPKAVKKAPETQASTATIEGVNHASERESVFKREKAERFALEHHLGEQTFADLQTAMTAAGLIAAKNRYTTQAAIERERDTIAVMQSGQNQVNAISTEYQVKRLLIAEHTLTDGQRNAIEKTALTRDQCIAWQGVAGAGKTYSLRLLTQLATEQGYEVTGYAPSAQAANVLSEEANIESNTVARLLHSQPQNQSSSQSSKQSPRQPLWIVDEAGLLSAKDAHALLKKAQRERARVVLVGDLRQLSAVEAGNPFNSLQQAGITTCTLEESRRQKTDALRAAVVCLAAGEPLEGLEQLERAEMVHEVTAQCDRHRQLVADYMSQPAAVRDKTLVLCGTNAARLAITAQLREALQADGSLGADAFTLRSLRALDRIKAQLKYAAGYAEGEVVVPERDYRRYGLEKGVQYTVTGRDLERNLVTVTGPDGSAISFDPSRCADKSTYAIQEVALAPGEQLRWTRNDKTKGTRNGQLVSVTAISLNGNATLKDADGQETTLNLSGQQYLDHALVSTTYASQGKTAERVLIADDGTLRKEGLYVAVSRAKRSLSLYAADRAALQQRAVRSSAKENPSDYVPLYELTYPDAQNPKAARTARDLHGRDQSEQLGADIGTSVAVGHCATVRRDSRAERRSEPAQSRTSQLTSDYVEHVRSVVAGIEQRHRAAELEGQAERIREAATAFVDSAEQLEQATAAVERLDLQFERQAEQLGQQQAEKERKRRRACEVYQRYAAEYVGNSDRTRDRLVAYRLMSQLLKARDGEKLSHDEL